MKRDFKALLAIGAVLVLAVLISNKAFLGAIARPTGLFSKTGVVFSDQDYSDIHPALTRATYVKVYEAKDCGAGYSSCWHSSIKFRYFVNPSYSTGCAEIEFEGRKITGEELQTLPTDAKVLPSLKDYYFAQACSGGIAPAGWVAMVDNNAVCETTFSEPEVPAGIICKLKAGISLEPTAPPVVGVPRDSCGRSETHADFGQPCTEVSTMPPRKDVAEKDFFSDFVFHIKEFFASIGAWLKGLLGLK